MKTKILRSSHKACPELVEGLLPQDDRNHRRLFLAIPLPLTTTQVLSQCSFSHPAIRWTSPDNLHITVYFFGSTPEEKIPELIKRIRAVTDTTQAFELTFEKCIFAPPKSTPRMIWADFQSNTEFEELFQKIQAIAVQFLHLRPENRPPHPHVTLARFRAHVNIRSLTLATPHLFPLNVTTLHLMESHLARSGAEYSLLEEFALRK